MKKLLLILPVLLLVGAGCSKTVPTKSPEPVAPPSQASQGEVKEFVMQSYYSPEQGRPFFSLKEMVVKKGDRVRVKVTNSFGTHNFVIDEYDLKQETPLNQETVIEFTADKAGEFVYYCSMPGHRAAGQWGTLKVSE